MTDTLIIAIVSAVTGAIVTVLLQRLGKSLGLAGQWLSRWYKYLTGTQQNRANTMAVKPPPLWLLKRTLFRWFQNEPQTFWPQLRQISESDPRSTETIENLMWTEDPIKDLQKGDVLYYGGHLLNKIFFRPAKLWLLHTADGNSTEYAADATMKTATGGWCSRKVCHFCPKKAPLNAENAEPPHPEQESHRPVHSRPHVPTATTPTRRTAR